MFKSKTFTVLLIILLIIVLAFVFPVPVFIEDALTNEPVSDFGIHISTLRIIFEPVLGLMLYFNRGIYTIDENFNVLYWVLIIFLIYTLIKYIRLKEGREKKNFLISQLINLPLVGGLWFVYFVILIFMSRYFPANTIVNNSSDKILVTTHAHTEFSHDGLVSQMGQWEWHKKNNFDAFFITDHNNHSKTLDFVKAQRNHEFPISPLVMCGEEFSGTNHLSLLGLKREFDTQKYSDQRVIDSVRANGGAVLVNHWFDGEKESLGFFKDLGVDGFEIENTATERTYDRKIYKKIKDFCEHNDLIMNGGLDYHGYGNVCSLWNAMTIPGWHKLDPEKKENSILDIFKNHDQSKLQVLLYRDRPEYTNKNLFWRPLITFVNYFRTLNGLQVVSWLIWILILAFLFKKRFTTNKVLPVLGIFGAIFLLLLGYQYYMKKLILINTENDIFDEYSLILFYSGAALLIYAAIIVYFRLVKNKEINTKW